MKGAEKFFSAVGDLPKKGKPSFPQTSSFPPSGEGHPHMPEPFYHERKKINWKKGNRRN